MIRHGIGLAAFTLMLPAPVLAQQPVNSVSCAFDSMGQEDREIALLLIAREFGQGGKFAPSSRNVSAVNDLIAEAQQKCRLRFSWSAVRADAASNYALTAILGEAIGQSLQSTGRSIASLEQFYRQNPVSQAGRSNQRRLAGYLGEQGWAEATDSELFLAWLYLETLMAKDQERRRFGAR